MDYSIRPLCFSHVDLPREFFGGVPIHSGEGVSSSPMIYVLLSGQDAAGVVHHHLVDAGLPRRQVDPPVRVLRLGVPGDGPRTRSGCARSRSRTSS